MSERFSSIGVNLHYPALCLRKRDTSESVEHVILFVTVIYTTGAGIEPTDIVGKMGFLPYRLMH